MDGPGISIFQGSDLKFSNSFQRIEEDELEEENRKREAELKDLFQDAFNDLNDDDDDDGSSLANSHYSDNQSEHEFRTMQNYNFTPLMNNIHELPMLNHHPRKDNLETITEKHNESTESLNVPNYPGSVESDVSGRHFTHCFKNGLNGFAQRTDADLIENYTNTEGGGYDELKVLYEVRLREVERLRRELNVEREAKEEVIHQLALCQSANNKITNEVTECQELIEKSKDRINELEESVDKMKVEILKLEKTHEKDQQEVKISHQQVICLEEKICAMERCDASANRMKQMDAFIENLNSKHQKELTILQNKLDSMESKLAQKENECHKLESKLDEVERKRAALVLEKCDGTARQESALQALLNKANEEKLDLNRQIVSLQSECSGLKSELEQYESVAKLRLCLGSSSDESGEVGRTGPSHLAKTRSASSLAKTMNPHNADLINNLRDELHRALLAKAAKRHEINKLQEQVRSKEIQIQEMKERERVYLSQADSLKADINKIVGQLSESKSSDQSTSVDKMKIEIDKLAHMNQLHIETIEELNVEIDKLKEDLKHEYSSKVRQGEDMIGLRESERAQLKSQTDELLKAKETEWRSQLDHIMKECDEIKQLYMDLRKSNGRLNDQLEFQKQHMSILERDKEKILNIHKEKEALVDKLKEENIKYKLEKEMKDRLPDSNSRDNSTIRLLETEVERLKNELSELPKKQTIELEGLKMELEAAKLRLLDLDKMLRHEFEIEISTLISDRNRLKEMIEQNDSLNRINKESKDVGVSIETTEKTEIIILKEELERLRNGLIPKSDEIYENKLTDELEGLEKRLVSEHKSELVATEERIKNIMVSYYANLIEEMKKKFEDELTKHITNEQSKIIELTRLLAQKDSEIQLFKRENAAEKIEILQKRFEDERKRFTDTIKQWSNQVESLKKKITDDDNKLQFLNQSLKRERKDAQKYKAKLDNAKKRIQQEKFENLLKIKSDLENFRDLSDIDGKKMAENLKLIEDEFNEKEKLLKQQFEVNKRNL